MRLMAEQADQAELGWLSLGLREHQLRCTSRGALAVGGSLASGVRQAVSVDDRFERKDGGDDGEGWEGLGKRLSSVFIRCWQ